MWNEILGLGGADERFVAVMSANAEKAKRTVAGDDAAAVVDLAQENAEQLIDAQTEKLLGHGTDN